MPHRCRLNVCCNRDYSVFQNDKKLSVKKQQCILLFVCPPVFWRNRVIAAFAERVAAQYAPCAQHKPFYYPVNFYCLHHIFAAGGYKAAVGAKQGRYACLVKFNRQYKEFLYHYILFLLCPTMFSAVPEPAAVLHMVFCRVAQG